MAQPDSKCEKSRTLIHNWMVYSHNVDWTRLGAFCTRCSLSTTMSANEYMDLLKMRSTVLENMMTRKRRP